MAQTYQKWFNDAIITFFLRWSLRNSSSKHVTSSEIIDPIVTSEVQTFFQFVDENHLSFSMRQIDLYLRSHMDVLLKKFFFYHQ